MTSFEFKWSDNNKQASSKVFKRKVFKDKSTEPQESESLSNKVNANKSNYNKSSVNNRKLLNKKNEHFHDEKPQMFIKRKRKKEKNTQEYDKDPKMSDNSNTSKHYSLFSEKNKRVYINTNFKGKSVIEKVFSAGKKFSELNIHKHIVSNLEKNSFSILTNVQEKAIPSVLTGQNVLVRSQTGSGKTIVYAVSILNNLVNVTPKLQRNDGVQAIIVVPTRELVLQTQELFKKLNTFQWIVIGHLCGGENRKTEKDRLRKGIHILISTPGRLLDHILHTSAFNIKNVNCLVLDEADRLLDMGFKKDIVRLVEELDNQKMYSSYDPIALLRGKKSEEDQTTDVTALTNSINSLENDAIKNRQCILLSATLSKGIAELADFTMKEHVYVDALDEFERTNMQHMIIPDTVKQEFILTFVKHRLVMLSALLILKARQGDSNIFVFMATSQMVDFHYELFKKYLLKMPRNRGKMKIGEVLLLDDVELSDSDDNEDCLDIELFKLHGSMSQTERKDVFSGFRKCSRGVLLCTDVAARGIDVPEADCIIQYTGPQSDDDYLHRVGRTGRAGKSGSAIIFLTHEEQEFISRLQDHKVFLKEYKADKILESLAVFMEESDGEKATLALQKRYETAISKDSDLHKRACFAYSSWARFYSSFPTKLKDIFDFKKINLGHYVTSFGLKETPTSVARTVKGQVSKVEPKKLNTKLANHKDDGEARRPSQKKPMKSLSLTTSEFSSGLEPVKKKRKKKLDD